MFTRRFLPQIGTKAIDLTADTFTAGLMTGDAAAWATGTVWGYQFVSAVTGAYTEISTVGTYTAGYAGRVALTTLTFTQQAATNDNICQLDVHVAGADRVRRRRGDDRGARRCSSTTRRRARRRTPARYVITIIDFGATVNSNAGGVHVHGGRDATAWSTSR